MTSIVFPDLEVSTSPGRMALPEGRFSTAGIRPTTLSGRPRVATAVMAPRTAAPPPMSIFISSIPSEGFSEMPPASKTTPLPIRTTGAASFLAPRYSMTISRGSRTLPWATPSIAPIPSSSNSSRSRMRQSKPHSSASSRAFPAKNSGDLTLPGSLTMSRATPTARQTFRASATPLSASAAWPLPATTTSIFSKAPGSSSRF